MLGASGSLLQAAEPTAEGGNDGAATAAASSAGAHQEGGVQPGCTGGVSSIMAEIEDEDTKGAGGGGDDELGVGGERGFLGGGSGGNRWPRQETLALLKIRSDMDVVFRDSSLKGPLWEEVARKMADVGYYRSAKKCKEKFENVYKYHKRTKEGRAGKSDGKTYRFSDQLEALETQHHHSLLLLPPGLPPPPRAPQPPQPAVPISIAMPPPQPPAPVPTSSIAPQQVTVPSTTTNPPPSSHIQPAMPNPVSFPSSSSGTPLSSSSTSSDEEILGIRRKRKRKWKDFFKRLMREVIGKQEELQRKFLEAIEKREQDRMVREEAWKVQEMARLNREHEILVQERSMAAAKDTALISFLQKLSDQQQIPLPPSVVVQSQSQPQPMTQQQQPVSTSNVEPVRMNNGDPNACYLPASSSRWPKTEVEALIKLRTSLEQKYQDSGPKEPLWEEISSAMKKQGYNRNAKRCKEKWENINKYFKKVKESNKKRPEDSKTCPYFHQLDALYREKNKADQGFGYWEKTTHQLAAVAPVAEGEEAMAAPIMVQPEQQWRLPPGQEHDRGSEDDDDDGDDDDDDDDQGGVFEIVANNNNGSSMGGAAVAMDNS